MENFVGVDLHRRVSQLAALREPKPASQLRFANDAVTVQKALKNLPQGSKIALEATGSWWWFVELARRAGHGVGGRKKGEKKGSDITVISISSIPLSIPNVAESALLWRGTTTKWAWLLIRHQAKKFNERFEADRYNKPRYCCLSPSEKKTSILRAPRCTT